MNPLIERLKVRVEYWKYQAEINHKMMGDHPELEKLKYDAEYYDSLSTDGEALISLFDVLYTSKTG